jgi:signal transduction histidine kinase
MAVITMTAANLADGIVSDPANVRRYGIILQEEGRRLARMVEQVLSYARIQAKNLPPREPTHVNVLVCSVVKSMQPGMTELGFSCTLQLAESLPTIMIDRFSMECVIQNLLSNALKYSADQRAIRVSTGKEKSRAGLRVWIEVQDQGIGIDPDEQSAIFQPFRRGRAAMERSLPGSGLGLSLVERIVQAHGGTVRLRSEPRKGSTFTVSLPAIKSAAG